MLLRLCPIGLEELQGEKLHSFSGKPAPFLTMNVFPHARSELHLYQSLRLSLHLLSHKSKSLVPYFYSLLTDIGEQLLGHPKAFSKPAPFPQPLLTGVCFSPNHRGGSPLDSLQFINVSLQS